MEASAVVDTREDTMQLSTIKVSAVDTREVSVDTREDTIQLSTIKVSAAADTKEVLVVDSADTREVSAAVETREVSAAVATREVSVDTIREVSVSVDTIREVSAAT